MKLRISDLTDAGIEVCGKLAAAALNERLNRDSDSGMLFEAPVAVKMHARRTAGGAELSGTLTGKYTQACGRCLEGVSRKIDIPSTFLIKSRPKGEKEIVDDVGVIYFFGEHCDLESPLQETVLLSMSVYWSPEIQPDGKCSVCLKRCGSAQISQAQCEQERGPTKLGELLKRLR